MKHILDLTVVSTVRLGDRFVHLRLTDERRPLPEDILPGQFTQVRIDNTPSVMLRRPISINMVDRSLNQLWLLVATIGDGTRWIGTRRPGDHINCVLPLGNTFSTNERESHLLVGGGVGVAPLLFLAKTLCDKGCRPRILLGARSKNDLLLRDEFERYGTVRVTTEDGSDGTRGFVTNDQWLADADSDDFPIIQCCGPTPMMKAVARVARQRNIPCEASLENQMACGLGACLCCVEPVRDGEATNNVCVCTEGPVFNTRQLLWQD